MSHHPVWSSSAVPRDREIEVRESRDQSDSRATPEQRIDEGVRWYRITQPEARQLVRQGRSIEQRDASFKSDGVVTQRERRQLRGELSDLRCRVGRLVSALKAERLRFT